MDSGKTILRWILIGLGVFLLMQYMPKFFGKGGGEVELQPLKEEGTQVPSDRAPETTCTIWTETFRAEFTNQGASIKHFDLLTAKYRRQGKPYPLSTTPDVELRRQLRVNLRNEAVAAPNDPAWQTNYDLVDWSPKVADGKTCVFEYSDEKVRLTKTITTTGRPYELNVALEVSNAAQQKLRHALTIDTTSWRLASEVSGGMFSPRPSLSDVECIAADGTAERARPDNFEPSDFKDAPFAPGPLNQGDWYQAKGSVAVAAVADAYFAQALVPETAPSGVAPVCQLQIEERWDNRRFKSKSDDHAAGAMYRARLAYPAVELDPQQNANYSVLAYIGPKERKLLTAAGGGQTRLIELIDLGFFSAIAKVLVGFLLSVHNVIPNWGIAIIVLTLTARLLLFPLSIPSIKSMMKMRELKPEIDALNEKFKNDPQAKGLAQMELWRKHNVNPLKGCLPQLASMPVWFALYTTLQTAVELFNIPFLWFPDLSLPDPLFILPFVIGATSFMQQKMMPMQGDPAQQKMMLYMMPAMFTVFMLFLPAGLGVYMFTNGVLGIIQQQLVERHARRSAANDPSSNVTTKPNAEGGAERRSSSAKGKAR
ncbi:MAG TPA: membrane protein insertase YidC [Polyangiaceae bacterium]|nr:membrane protein insertase YidC [Polyangiaceae bacterium]